MPAAEQGVDFTVDRFEREDGRLVVVGRWSGVRGLRFVRPTLLVGDERVLAELDHKPWAPHDGEEWIAAFPWPDEPAPRNDVVLAVAPHVTVPLGNGRGRKAAAARDTPAKKAAPRAQPKQRGPSPAEQALRAELDGERRRREELESELAALRARLEEVDALSASLRTAAKERDEAIAAEHHATSQRDEALSARDNAASERAEAAAQRDAALAARDEALADRERAVAERDQARTALKRARRSAVPRPRPPVTGADGEEPLGMRVQGPLTAHVEPVVVRVGNTRRSPLDLWVMAFMGGVALVGLIVIAVTLVGALN